MLSLASTLRLPPYKTRSRACNVYMYLYVCECVFAAWSCTNPIRSFSSRETLRLLRQCSAIKYFFLFMWGCGVTFVRWHKTFFLHFRQLSAFSDQKFHFELFRPYKIESFLLKKKKDLSKKETRLLNKKNSPPIWITAPTIALNLCVSEMLGD